MQLSTIIGLMYGAESLLMFKLVSLRETQKVKIKGLRVTKKRGKEKWYIYTHDGP
jgi:hypothetical protein